MGPYSWIPSGYLLHSHGKSPFLIGKPSINGPFSMAMLNNQMVNQNNSPSCEEKTCWDSSPN